MHHVSAGGYIFFNNGVEDFVVLIKNSQNEYLFPKGHVENNESFLETAKREIEEEVGIKKEDLKELSGAPVVKIEYIFKNDNGENETKEVHIFPLTVSYMYELKKEDNPKIIEVGWFPVEKAKELISYNKEAFLQTYNIYKSLC
jgi:8-oxo-dGTP pyrophosphatase MutT (NUDIX family)